MAKIGQGTFGEVFKARDRRNNKKVALKKVLMDNEKEGVSVQFLFFLMIKSHVHLPVYSFPLRRYVKFAFCNC